MAAEAIARARRGDGPTLIEAETYRFRGHSLADPDELRSKEEKEFFAKKDPIPMLESWIVANGLGTKEELAALRSKVDKTVDESVEFADASPVPERKQLLENVFVDPRGFGVSADGRYHYEARCRFPPRGAPFARVYRPLAAAAEALTRCLPRAPPLPPRAARQHPEFLEGTANV